MSDSETLELRIQALENAVFAHPPMDLKPGPTPDKEHLLESTRLVAQLADENGKQGAISYSGTHTTTSNSEFAWVHRALSTDALIAMDLSDASATFSVLANPMRLNVYLLVLEQSGTAMEIHERTGARTPGQTYNALSQLRDCGLLRRDAAGVFSVVANMVGGVMLMLAGVWNLISTDYEPLQPLSPDPLTAPD